MLNVKNKRFGKELALAVLMIFLFVMVLPTGIFGANESSSQDISKLESGKTLDGPGFFAGDIIRVDGTVEGTTFVTGQDVRINGHINGDLFVAAQMVDISGNVTGNIYCAGQNLTFGGQNTGDVFIAGQNIKLDKEGMIGRDLFAAGNSIIVNGTVPRDFHGGGYDILINGLIGRDAELEANNIEIKDSAIISGDLTYKSERQAYVAPNSKISGQTDWSMTEKKTETTKNPFIGKLLSVASALLIWFVIRVWKPNFWKKTSDLISEKPVKTLGIGAIALIVTPILAILAMITIIGLPLGVLLGIGYGVSLYLSKIVAAAFLGSWMMKRFGWSEIHKGVWLVLLSLVIITGLRMVPILGFLIWILIVFAGLGAIIASNFRTKETMVEKIE
jgi:cytoskeletal protein CcmA (bactofilin family)